MMHRHKSTFSALSIASWMMDLRVRLSAGFSVRSVSLRLNRRSRQPS